MNILKVIEMISKENILDRTNKGLDVFKHYLGFNCRIGKNFNNPLYEDKRASCNIYYDRKSYSYRMKDFGNIEYSGDCFFLVGKINGLNCNNTTDFIEILKIINNDLSLGLMGSSPSIQKKQVRTQDKQHVEEPKKTVVYSFAEKTFSREELFYWNQYGIDVEILSLYNVSSLWEYKSENKENKPFTIKSTPEEPLYGYVNRRFIKIYRPFSNLRFLYGGTPEETYCFGLEQLPSKGDTLYITGGEKDVLALAGHGFNAICFNSETASIPENLIYKLTFRFKHIILLYDMDKTGLECSAKHEKSLAQYGVKRLLLPLSGEKDEKDIADYFKKGNSRKDFLKLFLEYLDTLYSETMTMLKSCEVDLKNPPVKAEEIIYTGEVPLGTQGNILCITGGEGTGKSNYVAALVAGALRPSGTNIDTLGMNVKDNRNKNAVLLYDTEQSEDQLHTNLTKLITRATLSEKPDELRGYYLAGMSRKERMNAIVQSMDMFYYKYNGIHMVVIDGIADLVKSVNDEVECIEVIDELYRLAGIYRTCIICVLHFVPNGLKLRGHLGSELQRKAASILSIELDSEPTVSVVKAIKVRDGSPLDVPLMQFQWDKEVNMHIYIGEKPREEKEKRKEKELLSVARKIFDENSFLTYNELSEKLQEIMDVKDRTAKSYIRFMREKEIIIKDPTNESYFILGCKI